MQIVKILRPGAVRVIGHQTSKKRLFQDISDVAAAIYGLNAGVALDGLQEREALGPTGVGHGIALPHARIDGITEVVGVFLKLEKSLDFDAVDRQPVNLLFALFAPKDQGVDHLKALALVSRTMRDPMVCAKLRANSDATTLYAVLTESRATQAA